VRDDVHKRLGVPEAGGRRQADPDGCHGGGVRGCYGSDTQKDLR